ncbi:MAG: hypothetical protein CSA42_07295 [Gammaproteobacteria bacterium]|nr:MAG: hypothetical protein CSA42_07295 [Gammaproteobacteria bacterium]
MSKQILIICIFLLTGCMSAAIRFWNNTGYELPEKERQIYDTCYDEADKFYNEKTQRELWYKVWTKCVEDKKR